jgi:hypothetical protein
MTQDKLLSEDEVFAQASSVKESTPTVDEKEILFPDVETWNINGELVTVSEFKFKHFSKLMKLVKIVFAHMGKNAEFTSFLDSDLAFFEEHGEEMLELLALNTGKPIEYFDTIPQETALIMMIKLMEVNVRFFMNRVQPTLKQKL